jgi:hypothetical protein
MLNLAYPSLIESRVTRTVFSPTEMECVCPTAIRRDCESIFIIAAFGATLLTSAVWVVVEPPSINLKFSFQPAFIVKFFEVVIMGASPPAKFGVE